MECSTRRWFTSIGRDTERRATVSQPRWETELIPATALVLSVLYPVNRRTGREGRKRKSASEANRAWPGPGEKKVGTPFFSFSSPEPPVPLASPAKGT